MARLLDQAWMDKLPMVFLGLHLAWREGANTTPAEMLYGESLQQFVPGSSPVDSVDTFVLTFFENMRSVSAMPSKHHSSPIPSSYLPQGLMTANNFYIRHDVV